MWVVPIDFQDGVNDFDVGVNESIFSLLYAQWRIWMPKSVLECWLKCKNRNWIWFMCKCSYFALMNVSLHYWSPFHANDCVFSRNEQQYVYSQIQPHWCMKFKPKIFTGIYQKISEKSLIQVIIQKNNHLE